MRSFWLILCGGLLNIASGSHGDNQKEFQGCLKDCRVAQRCDINFFPPGQSILNRLFLWDCASECKYQCMWKVERMNRQKGLPIYQYYGKWPFIRVLGCQELFSVVFSVGNLLAHYYGYHYIYLTVMAGRTANWFLHGAIMVNYLTSINAWLWSSVFHARDCNATMYLDYCSAIALVFACMTTAIIRIFNIHSRRRQLLVIIPIVLYYLKHVGYMLLIHFDFSWNMTVGVASGLVYILSFLTWSISHLVAGKRPHAKYALISCIGGIMAAMLELNDFPPIWKCIDAHALWHAATIPINLLWCIFYREDALYDVGAKTPSKSPTLKV